MSLPPIQLLPEQLAYAETSQWKNMIKQYAAKLRCASPGIVESFNAANQTVSVQIATTELVQQPDGPEWMALPVVDNVPIMLLGAGGFTITVPVAAGDEGMLIFCDTCIDLWWQSSGVQPPPGPGTPIVQPQHERRRHDFWDCGFYPGMKSLPNMLADYSTTSLQIRSNDGTVIIDVAEAGITLTAPKVQFNTTGDSDVTASGKINFTSTSDMDLTASGDINLNGSHYSLAGIQNYAGNAAALAAGLLVNQLYRNGDALCIVH